MKPSNKTLSLAASVMLLILTGCASSGTTGGQPTSGVGGTPIVTTTGSQRSLVPVPLGVASGPGVPQPQGRGIALGQPPQTGTTTVDGVSSDARLRQLDDHYARSASETRQLVQQALSAIKATPSAAEVAAVKATIGRLEAQVTRLTTANTRTEGALVGLTTRLQQMERTASEEKAERAAAVPVPVPAQAREKAAGTAARQPTDPEEASFIQALDAMQGPARATEPMRAWLELHPNHARVPEGLFQLGMFFLNRGYQVAATYYFRRLTGEHPMTLQAKEAQPILATLPPAPASQPKAPPKKKVKAPKADATAATPPAPLTGPPADIKLPTLGPPTTTAPPTSSSETPRATSGPVGTTPAPPTGQTKPANPGGEVHLLVPGPPTPASSQSSSVPARSSQGVPEKPASDQRK